jgi:uncharacterized membrane protein
MAIELHHEIEIDAPARRAWALLADYALDPEWRAGVVSMEPTPPGPVGVGTTTAEVLRFAGRTMRNEGVVVAVDDGRRFEWRTTAGAADADGAREVEALDADRCRVRLELTVRPHGVDRALAPVTRRVLDRNLRADLRRLRALVAARAAVEM